MKILLLTDLHFGARGDAEAVKLQQKYFFQYIMTRVRPDAYDKIYILGDTFDKRKNVNIQTLKFAKDMLKELIFADKDNPKETVILVGNHDAYYFNTNELNSVQLLLEDDEELAKHVKVVTDSCYVDDMFLVPWITESNIEDFFRLIVKSDHKIVLGHLELKGFPMYKGHVMDKGMNHAVFKKFELVLSGHYHHKSVKDNVHYLGTGYQMNWNDYGDIDKGFHILDTETLEMDFYENPDRLFYVEYYNDEGKEGVKQHHKDKYVKLIVEEEIENQTAFDEYVDRLNEVTADLTIVDKTFIKHEQIELEDVEDTMTIIEEDIDNLTLNDERKTKLKEKMKKLYREAAELS